MYEYIYGKLALKKIDYAVLDVNGIGYKLYTTLSTYNKLKNEYEKLYVVSYVREDTIRLYGFYDESEKEMFSIFLSASGIGPKLAIAILSTYTTAELKEIILSENLKELSKVPGVGPKKGQKIIFELKDKIKNRLKHIDSIEFKENNTTYIEEDVKLALDSLGYNDKDIEKFLDKVDINSYKDTESAIRDIFKIINKK